MSPLPLRGPGPPPDEQTDGVLRGLRPPSVRRSGGVAEDLPPACSLLLVGPQHMLDACASRDVYTLATPIRREETVSTVKLLLQFGHRMERFTAARRSGSDQAVVDRAKRLLIDRLGMTEDQAHRELQKRSMDTGARLSHTARQVIRELEK